MNPKFLLPKISATKLNEVGELVDKIEWKINSKEDASDLIEKFNNLTICHIDDLYYFRTYYGSMTRDEFVANTLIPIYTKDPSITEEELFSLIQYIMKGEYPDERNLRYWMDILEVNLPGGEKISDLIFWNNLTPEEVFEKAKTPFVSQNVCEMCGQEIEGSYMFTKHKKECKKKKN